MYLESPKLRKLLAACTGSNLLVDYLAKSALRLDFDYGLGSSLTVSNPHASSNSVYLTWDASTPPAGATAWRIQRSSNGQTFQTYAEVDIAYSGFFDDGDDDPGLTGPGLPDGTRYWYRVRAIGADTEQAYTPKHGGTTTLPAPTIDTPTALSSRKIRINWTDNSQHATEFIVYRSPHGANDYEPIATVPGGGANEYIDSNLSINTTHDYYVTARNTVTESGPSSFVNATTMTLTADMTASVLALITGKTASATTYDLYNSIDDTAGTHGEYERNPDVWAAGVNLTGIPVYNSMWGSISAAWGAWANGALVTSKHLIQAKHFDPHMTAGTELRFVTLDNEVEVAEVASNYEISGTDLVVVTLDRDLPSTITPFQVLPADIASLLPGLSNGVPVLMNNQDRELRIGAWTNASYSHVYDGQTFVESIIGQPSGTAYDSWYKTQRLNDSGSAALSLLGTTPVLIGTWHFVGVSSNAFLSISAINAVLGQGYSLAVYPT